MVLGLNYFSDESDKFRAQVANKLYSSSI